jgi:hypothetical protein
MGDVLSRRFATEVAAGERQVLETEVEADATVEQVDVRFYPGSRLELELRPFIRTKRGNQIDLIDTVGRDVVVGDNDFFQFDVVEQAEEGATLAVEAVNNDPSNSYNFAVDIRVDRTAGLSRAITEVF